MKDLLLNPKICPQNVKNKDFILLWSSVLNMLEKHLFHFCTVPTCCRKKITLLRVLLELSALPVAGPAWLSSPVSLICLTSVNLCLFMECPYFIILAPAHLCPVFFLIIILIPINLLVLSPTSRMWIHTATAQLSSTYGNVFQNSVPQTWITSKTIILLIMTYVKRLWHW